MSRSGRLYRITIVGTGLIGASVGLALRASRFEGEITGWDRDPEQLRIALSKGAIDAAAGDPLEAATDSDLVLLSGPVLRLWTGWNGSRRCFRRISW